MDSETEDKTSIEQKVSRLQKVLKSETFIRRKENELNEIHSSRIDSLERLLQDKDSYIAGIQTQYNSLLAKYKKMKRKYSWLVWDDWNESII